MAEFTDEELQRFVYQATAEKVLEDIDEFIDASLDSIGEEGNDTWLRIAQIFAQAPEAAEVFIKQLFLRLYDAERG